MPIIIVPLFAPCSSARYEPVMNDAYAPVGAVRQRFLLAPPPPRWEIISLASVHQDPNACQLLGANGTRGSLPSLLRPDRWRHYGAAALLFSSRHAVQRLLRVFREEPARYARHRHFDMKLFATQHSNTFIACPPVLHWVKSYSDILHETRAAPEATGILHS